MIGPKTVELRLNPRALNKHITTWRGRVAMRYDLDSRTLAINVPDVAERWLVSVRPPAAMKIARSFSASLRVT